VRLFGYEFRLTKGTPTPVEDRYGWHSIIREPHTGAWQQNVEIRHNTVLSYTAVYACISLIAADIAKLRLKLMEFTKDGVWRETDSPAFSPVIRKPNRYQNRIQFYQQWLASKLSRGNTYVLKERDHRGVVVALYILDPEKVKPLVAPDGSVYYEVRQNHLAGVADDTVTIPAEEIIHDRHIPLYHPLVGVSPLHAAALAATQGIAIQNNSAAFFQNSSRPSGILTAPGPIQPETAAALRDKWQTNYSGANAGRVAVLGDGLKFESMSMTAVDAQMIEQLKWTAENVCTAFSVPAYKVGIGTMPATQNAELLNQNYYSNCLQILLESIELCLDEGLGLERKKSGRELGVEFDIGDLLRMDQATATKTAAEAVGAGFLKINEARARFDLAPVVGGDTPYLQQQNFSLAALDERDKDKPFAQPAPPAPEEDQTDKALHTLFRKRGLANA
jgi:HK97 family phage portal protein